MSRLATESGGFSRVTALQLVELAPPLAMRESTSGDTSGTTTAPAAHPVGAWWAFGWRRLSAVNSFLYESRACSAPFNFEPRRIDLGLEPAAREKKSPPPSRFGHAHDCAA